MVLLFSSNQFDADSILFNNSVDFAKLINDETNLILWSVIIQFNSVFFSSDGASEVKLIMLLNIKCLLHTHESRWGSGPVKIKKNRTKHHKSFTEVLVQYKSSVLKSFNTFVWGIDWKLRKSHLKSVVTIHFKWIEKKLGFFVCIDSFHEEIKSTEVNKYNYFNFEWTVPLRDVCLQIMSLLYI